jgi:hypothetical protein
MQKLLLFYQNCVFCKLVKTGAALMNLALDSTIHIDLRMLQLVLCVKVYQMVETDRTKYVVS